MDIKLFFYIGMATEAELFLWLAVFVAWSRGGLPVHYWPVMAEQSLPQGSQLWRRLWVTGRG